jgi:hypothetical protein
LAQKVRAALELNLTAQAWSVLDSVAKLLEDGLRLLDHPSLQRPAGRRNEKYRHWSNPLGLICWCHAPQATKAQVRKFAAEVFALGGISCDPEGHPERLDALIWPPPKIGAPKRPE